MKEILEFPALQEDSTGTFNNIHIKIAKIKMRQSLICETVMLFENFQRS